LQKKALLASLSSGFDDELCDKDVYNAGTVHSGDTFGFSAMEDKFKSHLFICLFGESGQQIVTRFPLCGAIASDI